MRSTPSPHDEENALRHDRAARGTGTDTDTDTDEPGTSAASAAPAADHDAPRDEDREETPGPSVAAAALGAGAGATARAPASQPPAPRAPVTPAAARAARAAVGRRGLRRRPQRFRRPGDSRSGGDRPSSDDGLAKVAGWTVLTSALPGSTSPRGCGRSAGLCSPCSFAVASIAAIFVIGDPLRIAATLGTHRGVLIGALVVVVVVGLVWCLQIVLANLAQTTKERLGGRQAVSRSPLAM